MDKIAAAFVKAQKGFAPALKSSTNPHFKSKYADLAACVEAVLDSLNSNGIALMQKTKQDETGVTVETVFVHESGETMSAGELHVPAARHDPQGYGSALTYARRYSLMAACGIAPEDDDGNAASRPSASASVNIDAFKKRVDACKDVKALNALWPAIANACAEANDVDAANTLKAYCAARKAQLTDMAAA